jgi:hypothetical protein
MQNVQSDNRLLLVTSLIVIRIDVRGVRRRAV